MKESQKGNEGGQGEGLNCKEKIIVGSVNWVPLDSIVGGIMLMMMLTMQRHLAPLRRLLNRSRNGATFSRLKVEDSNCHFLNFTVVEIL